MPGTIKSRTVSLTDQFTRLAEESREITMAQETEQGGIGKLMELMITMQMQDKERIAQRELERSEREEKEKRKRIEWEMEREEKRLEWEDKYRREQTEREKKREDERERRQNLLMTTLKEAQPTVPQKVTIQNLMLPTMKEGDDPVDFINYLEAALRRAKVPEDEWAAQAQTRITLKVAQTLCDILGDEHATYQDIKDAITGVSRKSFAAAAEEFFVPFKDGKIPTARALGDRFQSLLRKLTQDATNESEMIEKLTVAGIRATLNENLKDLYGPI